MEFGSGFNEIIAMDDGVSLKYMFTDALGSVTAVEVTACDAYGNRKNDKLVTVPSFPGLIRYIYF